MTREWQLKASVCVCVLAEVRVLQTALTSLSVSEQHLYSISFNLFAVAFPLSNWIFHLCKSKGECHQAERQKEKGIYLHRRNSSPPRIVDAERYMPQCTLGIGQYCQKGAVFRERSCLEVLMRVELEVE